MSVRLISQDGKPKGFGYVEFETLDGLKAALDKNQSQLANRTVRVSVAEAREYFTLYSLHIIFQTY